MILFPFSLCRCLVSVRSALPRWIVLRQAVVLLRSLLLRDVLHVVSGAVCPGTYGIQVGPPPPAHNSVLPGGLCHLCGIHTCVWLQAPLERRDRGSPARSAGRSPHGAIHLWLLQRARPSLPGCWKCWKRRQRTQAQSSDRRHGQKPLLLQQACMSLTFDLWEHWMLQCHILYTNTDITLSHRTTLPFHTHRESEWMHELTLNIRFYTSLQSVFIPSFVLCTLIHIKCTDRLTSNEPWGTLLYQSTKTNFSKGNWSFPWQPQNHRLTFIHSPYFCCWKRFFRHGKESELL